MILAERYHWTPDQVDALDPDVLMELVEYMRAHADVEATARKRAQRARRNG